MDIIDAFYPKPSYDEVVAENKFLWSIIEKNKNWYENVPSNLECYASFIDQLSKFSKFLYRRATGHEMENTSNHGANSGALRNIAAGIRQWNKYLKQELDKHEQK